ncbi:tumor necrosis factor ligand superfamily member 14 [Tachyglossus aculeatus]|uniref:tumor necrosis factor ligand superfamily member 14 n=1 Tax=Tachyglossus aculeatus TaxID=9261 RepID=UPI0018F483DD|nr:tumor necrosis factor ligand superfamily member 14 [Tachyglossus aculeatus]
MEEQIVHPSVFVVDGQQDLPFAPPRLSKRRTCQWTQLALGILVLLALIGVASEAYFLLGLHRNLKGISAQMASGDHSSLEKMVQERKSQQDKPAAHLTGANYSLVGESGLLWEPSLGLAFLHSMSYHEGSLICTHPGYYFVYSKVQLGDISCSSGRRDGDTFITHGLYKRTPRYPEEMELMINRRPYCDRPGNELWWDNSFLGGIVHLEEEEKIFIRVSKKRLVRVKDGTRSYFGAFMI